MPFELLRALMVREFDIPPDEIDDHSAHELIRVFNILATYDGAIEKKREAKTSKKSRLR